MISLEQKRIFDENGYVLVRQLFQPDEVAFYRDHYMRLRENGSYPGDLVAQGADRDTSDPLKRYPRMIHMHRWDEVSLHWMIDKRLNACMTALLGVEPFAVQTMLYFKPPGARGQALHQDNYYLRVQPGTCLAAWLALDLCDEANGCLQVVPGSNHWPILCTAPADTTQSFTDITVPVPEGYTPQPILMDAGDILFFNGSLVHGSFPNQTTERFRRALIGHYIQGEAQQVAHWYHPTLRMDGTIVQLEVSPDGDSCGRWVDEDGKPVIEMTAVDIGARGME